MVSLLRNPRAALLVLLGNLVDNLLGSLLGNPRAALRILLDNPADNLLVNLPGSPPRDQRLRGRHINLLDSPLDSLLVSLLDSPQLLLQGSPQDNLVASRPKHQRRADLLSQGTLIRLLPLPHKLR